MKRDEVPDGFLPVRCLRCDDWLAVPHDADAAQRQEIGLDHHMWLCPVPTPNLELLRARSRAMLGFDP